MLFEYITFGPAEGGRRISDEWNGSGLFAGLEFDKVAQKISKDHLITKTTFRVTLNRLSTA